MASGFRMDGFILKLYHSRAKTYSILMTMATRPVFFRKSVFLFFVLAILCPIDLFSQDCPELLNVLPSGLKNLDAENHKVYFTVGRTFYILDISDPVNPQPLSFMFLPTDISAVDVVGDYAYVACQGDTFWGVEGSLKVIDVSNPSAPMEVASLGPFLWARHLCVSGNYAYVSELEGGLKIIDISDPENPCEAGAWVKENEWIYLSVVVDNIAHVQYIGNISIVDVSDPQNPVEMSQYDVEGRNIYLEGHYAYIVDWRDMRIFDVSDLCHPVEIAVIDKPIVPGDVAVYHDYAYVTDRDYGMRIFDVSDRSHPIELNLREDLEGITNLFLLTDEQNLYAWGHSYLNLNILDLSDPENPSLAGFFPTFSGGSDIGYKDGNMYVLSGGLSVYDITDPYHPTVVCNYDRGLGYTMYILGSRAYTGGPMFLVLDISDPSHPLEIGSYDNPGNIQDIFVFNDYAYIANDTKGLRIIDVSDVDHLSEVGAIEDIISRGVDILYPYAYVISGYGLMYAIDINDPYHPTVVSYLEHDGNATNIEVSYPYAYIAGYGDGFHINI